jgi:hypothetical protein
MNQLNLTALLILCCLFFSCNPKTEKKQPTINYNNQNYKLDDDEILNRNTKDIKKKTPSDNSKSKKIGVKK